MLTWLYVIEVVKWDWGTPPSFLPASWASYTEWLCFFVQVGYVYKCIVIYTYLHIDKHLVFLHRPWALIWSWDIGNTQLQWTGKSNLSLLRQARFFWKPSVTSTCRMNLKVQLVRWRADGLEDPGKIHQNNVGFLRLFSLAPYLLESKICEESLSFQRKRWLKGHELNRLVHNIHP